MQELLGGHICLGPSVYKYSALGCSLNLDMNTDTRSIILLSRNSSLFFLSLHALWPKLLYLTPVQLETAFCSIRLAQQEPVTAISYSQATSAQPDESKEYFRCAALSLAASFAELL